MTEVFSSIIVALKKQNRSNSLFFMYLGMAGIAGGPQSLSHHADGY